MTELFNLQLFAEAEGTPYQEAEPQETDPKSGDGKPTEKPVAKYTDEDVNEILNRKFAEWAKKRDKEVSEAQKLAEMGAQERAEYQRDQLQKQLDELTRKAALADMAKVARSMLEEQDAPADDALVELLISDDAEQTKNAVGAFSKAFHAAVDAAVKDKLRGAPPKRGGASGITREQILAVKNRAERQRLINENMDLFKGGN